MSKAERDQMVADPIALIESGSKEAGLAMFERLAEAQRRNGKPTVRSEDLLSAFGVRLYEIDQKALSVSYLERAEREAEQVYGPIHPEVALALNDIADVMRSRESDPPPAADEALKRALSIRQTTLGPMNGETLMTQVYLAEIEGLPSRTNGNPERIDAAIGKIEHAFAISDRSPNLTLRDRADMLFQEARLNVLNHRLDEGQAAFRRLLEFDQAAPEWLSADSHRLFFSEALAKAGYSAEAEAISPLGGNRSEGRSTDQNPRQTRPTE